MTCKIDPKQLRLGINIEMEHTSSRKKAEQIAKEHLCQKGFENYYTALIKMEKELTKKR